MTTDPIELLKQIAHRYHHFKQENKQKGPVSSRNRHHQQVLQELERDFERAVDRWVDDDKLHDAWIAHFYHFTPAPRGPRLPTPPLFKGRDANGQSAQLVPVEGGQCALEIDGQPVRRVPERAARLPARRLKKLRVGAHEFEEVFEAPEEAQAALDQYTVEPQKGAPWKYVGALYRDGVIDPNFGLTPRGRRLIEARRGHGIGLELTLH